MRSGVIVAAIGFIERNEVIMRRTVALFAIALVVGFSGVRAQQSTRVMTLTLQDYEEIRNVHASLTHLLDFKDAEGLGDIFTPDGEVWQIWGPTEKLHAKGRKEVMAMVTAGRAGATGHF